VGKTKLLGTRTSAHHWQYENQHGKTEGFREKPAQSQLTTKQGLQMAKKNPCCHGSKWFITALTQINHWTHHKQI
jgi:hypothetical protein